MDALPLNLRLRKGGIPYPRLKMNINSSDLCSRVTRYGDRYQTESLIWGDAPSITKHAFGIRTHEVAIFQTSLLGKWVQVSVLQKYCISLRLMQQIQISKFNNSIIHHFQDDVKWKFLITWTLFVNYSPIKWWSSRNLPWFFLASMSMVSFRTCCEISCVFNLKWSGMAVMLRRH